MVDLIDRAEAQTEIMMSKNVYMLKGEPSISVSDAVQVLRQMPSVSTEKTGRWIKSRDSYGNNHFTCPFCEHDIATKYDGTWKDNYCSNCGCRMTGVEE